VGIKVSGALWNYKSAQCFVELMIKILFFNNLSGGIQKEQRVGRHVVVDLQISFNRNMYADACTHVNSDNVCTVHFYASFTTCSTSDEKVCPRTLKYVYPCCNISALRLSNVSLSYSNIEQCIAFTHITHRRQRDARQGFQRQFSSYYFVLSLRSSVCRIRTSSLKKSQQHARRFC
jgi:hypothetical protein